MTKQDVFGRLIGLAGAIQNGEKTEGTDALILRALTLCGQDAPKEEQLSELYESLAKEKAQISPNCSCCKNPCGNTSDYDMRLLEEADAKISEAKKELIRLLTEELPRKFSDEANVELPQIAFKALSFIGYDLQINSYNNVLEEMKTWLDK